LWKNTLIYDEEYFSGKTNKGYRRGYSRFPQLIYNKIKLRKALSIINKYHKHGTFLDVGCAFGFLVKMASRKGYSATGCDISRYAIKQAQALFPELDFFEANIEKRTPFETSSFDIVTALDTLEHCSDVHGALREIKRLLKPQGLFLTSIPVNPLARIYDDTHKHKSDLSEWLCLLSKYFVPIRTFDSFKNKFTWINPDWWESLFILCRNSNRNQNLANTDTSFRFVKTK